MCEKYDSEELLEEMKLSVPVDEDSNTNRQRHCSGATNVSLSDSELDNNDSIDPYQRRDKDMSSLVPSNTLVRSTSLNNRSKTICFDNGGFTVVRNIQY